MGGEPVSGLGAIKKSIPEGTPLDMGGIISFEDYSFTYISSEEPAIKNVNLQIELGEVVLLAGSSGCGKST
ncbi:MAG: ATP-binding cassette domain-containing protein, partial [Nitrososphaerales archaeon]